MAESSAQFAYSVTGQVHSDGQVTMQLTDTVFVSIDYEYAGQVRNGGQRIEGALLQGGIPGEFTWTRAQ